MAFPAEEREADSACIFCSSVNKDNLTSLAQVKVTENITASKYLKEFSNLAVSEAFVDSGSSCLDCVNELKRLHSMKEEVRAAERRLFKCLVRVELRLWTTDDVTEEDELMETLVTDVKKCLGDHLVLSKQEASNFKSSDEGMIFASKKDLEEIVGCVNSLGKGRILWSREAGKKILGLNNTNGVACLSCDGVFEDLVSSECHLDGGCSKEYACKFCGKMFLAKCQLRLHEINHKGRFECLLCEETFTRKASLQEHISRHKGVKDKECPVCHKMFYATSFWRHMSTFHAKEGKLIHQCEKCGKKFSQSFKLKLHESSHNARQFKCEKCPARSFKTEKHLKGHYSHVHSKDASQSSTDLCQKCGNFFKKRGFHVCPTGTAIAGLAPETHACDICGKNFGTDDDLLIHQSENHGLLGFTSKDRLTEDIIVDIIDAPIGRGKDEDDHQTIVIEEDGSIGLSMNLNLLSAPETPPPLDVETCNVCQRVFSSQKFLKDHLKVHKEEKTRYCRVCNKTFKTHQILSRHLVTHTGEKPYKCEYCEKAFSFSSNLSEHITLHTGKMSGECGICKKKFRLSSSLRKHKLRGLCLAANR